MLVADSDLYVAMIDEKVMTKIGERYEVDKELIPRDFRLATSNTDYAVWEKNSSAY